MRDGAEGAANIADVRIVEHGAAWRDARWRDVGWRGHDAPRGKYCLSDLTTVRPADDRMRALGDRRARTADCEAAAEPDGGRTAASRHLGRIEVHV